MIFAKKPFFSTVEYDIFFTTPILSFFHYDLNIYYKYPKEVLITLKDIKNEV